VPGASLPCGLVSLLVVCTSRPLILARPQLSFCPWPLTPSPSPSHSALSTHLSPSVELVCYSLLVALYPDSSAFTRPFLSFSFPSSHLLPSFHPLSSLFPFTSPSSSSCPHLPLRRRPFDALDFPYSSRASGHNLDTTQSHVDARRPISVCKH